MNQSFLRFLPIVVLFASFPLFEGCESPDGLLLVHSITLITALFILAQGKLHIPKFLRYFVPFLVFLPVSVAIAPYKYSALLELWDYWVAAIFSITAFTLLKENQDNLEELSFVLFTIATASTILSVLLLDDLTLLRWKGSFVNPNDFGTFCLLLMIFGLFQYERLNSQPKKMITLAGIVALMTFITMASSRSVFVASAIVFGYYLWKKRTTRFMKIFIALVLLSSTIALSARFLFYTDPFQYYRLRIWKYSLQGILQDPYLGIGLNMLPFRAAQYNFPADVEAGRYARVATSADNQYLQLLIETGFVGFFLFLIGWIALYFVLRRLENRFLAFRTVHLALSVICMFMLPFDSTAILFVFVFLILFPFSLDPFGEAMSVKLKLPFRLILVPFMAAVLIFAVLIPYWADREFRLAFQTKDPKRFESHLKKAIQLNPIQPYYRFSGLRRAVDSKAELEPKQWLAIVSYLKKLTELNPLEPDFHVYQAKIYRILMEKLYSPILYKEAINSYASAIQLSPHNVFMRAEYAFFEYRFGRLDKARSELRTILELEPAYLNARLLLAEVSLKEGDPEQAKLQFQEAQRLQNKYKSFLSTGNEPYVRKLLYVDPRYMKAVQQLLFS